MDDRKLDVTLTGPAKVNGVRQAAGKTITVSATVALQLAASGVINPALAQSLSQAFDGSDTPLESDFQEAVDAAVSAALVPVVAGRDQALAHISELEGQLAEARTEIGKLTESLEAAVIARADLEVKLAAAEAENAAAPKNTRKT